MADPWNRPGIAGGETLNPFSAERRELRGAQREHKQTGQKAQKAATTVDELRLKDIEAEIAQHKKPQVPGSPEMQTATDSIKKLEKERDQIVERARKTPGSTATSARLEAARRRIETNSARRAKRRGRVAKGLGAGALAGAAWQVADWMAKNKAMSNAGEAEAKLAQLLVDDVIAGGQLTPEELAMLQRYMPEQAYDALIETAARRQQGDPEAERVAEGLQNGELVPDDEVAEIQDEVEQARRAEAETGWRPGELIRKAFGWGEPAPEPAPEPASAEPAPATPRPLPARPFTPTPRPPSETAGPVSPTRRPMGGGLDFGRVLMSMIGPAEAAGMPAPYVPTLEEEVMLDAERGYRGFDDTVASWLEGGPLEAPVEQLQRYAAGETDELSLLPDWLNTAGLVAERATGGMLDPLNYGRQLLSGELLLPESWTGPEAPRPADEAVADLYMSAQDLANMGRQSDLLGPLIDETLSVEEDPRFGARMSPLEAQRMARQQLLGAAEDQRAIRQQALGERPAMGTGTGTRTLADLLPAARDPAQVEEMIASYYGGGAPANMPPPVAVDPGVTRAQRGLLDAPVWPRAPSESLETDELIRSLIRDDEVAHPRGQDEPVAAVEPVAEPAAEPGLPGLNWIQRMFAAEAAGAPPGTVPGADAPPVVGPGATGGGVWPGIRSRAETMAGDVGGLADKVVSGIAFGPMPHDPATAENRGNVVPATPAQIEAEAAQAAEAARAARAAEAASPPAQGGASPEAIAEEALRFSLPAEAGLGETARTAPPPRPARRRAAGGGDFNASRSRPAATLADDAEAAEEELNWIQRQMRDRLGMDASERSRAAEALVAFGSTMATTPGSVLEGFNTGAAAGLGQLQAAEQREYEREQDALDRAAVEAEARAKAARDAVREWSDMSPLEQVLRMEQAFLEMGLDPEEARARAERYAEVPSEEVYNKLDSNLAAVLLGRDFD